MILHFLHSHSTTSLTADDVAYHLAKPIEAIERDLTTLAQLRLVQTTRVAGVTFYCLTHEPSRRKLVHELCAWQDSWETRVRAIVLMIWGNGASATYIAPARMREFHSAFHAAKGLTPAHAPILPPTLEREVKWTKPF
ncbi:MAG: hypothetical protein HY868_05060 [Chloroflexi bacterium]|nr:hypothetical protein [Chloroflexota bacterium]